MDSFGRLDNDILDKIKLMYFKDYGIESKCFIGRMSTNPTVKIEYEFEILIKIHAIKIRINMSHPLNMYRNEYSEDNFDPKIEWKNLYNAIEHNQPYRIDLDKNETNLMFDCTGEVLQISSIPRDSDHNMIDIIQFYL